MNQMIASKAPVVIGLVLKFSAGTFLEAAQQVAERVKSLCS